MEIKAEINKRNKKNNGKKSVKLKLGSLERPIARKTEKKKKKEVKRVTNISNEKRLHCNKFYRQ